VLPTDDDDWFAPDVAIAIEGQRDPAAIGYHWIPAFVEVPMHFGNRLGPIRRRAFPWTAPKFPFSTNTYAVEKSQETHALLGDHGDASGWSIAETRMKRIGRRLSVQNRTLASQTSLGQGRLPPISRRQLERKFRRYRELYREAVQPELAWCAPYLATMAELMDELRLR
jgi:hypothetical protein